MVKIRGGNVSLFKWIKRINVCIAAHDRHRASYRFMSRTRAINNMRLAAHRRIEHHNARMSLAVSLLVIAMAKPVRAEHTLTCINI